VAYYIKICVVVNLSVIEVHIFHRQLHSDRDPIPDVPAVYFCLPTEENLCRIGQDLQSNLYDCYHLNFISPISRQRLEDLAAAALQANCVSQIQKVIDFRVSYNAECSECGCNCLIPDVF
jgi:hypothetical protein